MIPQTMVWPLSVVGFIVFSFGIAAGGYLMLKTGSWKLSASIDKYQSDRDQRQWPVWCVYTFIPLGFAIIFGAILASK
jgi:hypothetical protein